MICLGCSVWPSRLTVAHSFILFDQHKIFFSSYNLNAYRWILPRQCFPCLPRPWRLLSKLSNGSMLVRWLGAQCYVSVKIFKQTSHAGETQVYEWKSDVIGAVLWDNGSGRKTYWSRKKWESRNQCSLRSLAGTGNSTSPIVLMACTTQFSNICVLHFFFLNWSIIALHCCVSLCCTMK